MSQWTHVSASIRFDGIMGIGLPTELDLGVICTFEDWNETDMPCGSEGGIEYTVIKNKDENSMAAMVVVFYGDLRDYEDSKEILSYFEKITNGRMIRSGILEIEIEYQEKLVYSFDSEESKWIKQ